jgi:hypothetical protein
MHGELRDLRRNWGSAYEITECLGVWRAARRDILAPLIATSPEKLRGLVEANYHARPVPRSCPADQPAPAAELPVLHPLMLPGEVCDVFGVAERTVGRWETAGDLACIRLPSGVRRYFRAQVEAHIRGEKLTPDQVRALREELAAHIKGRPMGYVGKDY